MQIQPIDFLSQMQSGDDSLLKPLQLGINIGLNSPTKLEQERQRADIDYQKEHRALLQQQIAASQQDKELAKRKFDLDQSAMQRVLDVYSDPNATLADIDAANNAIMYLKPELAAKIEATRKAREERINQFEENTFAKLFSVRDNPETLKQEIDNALIAAKKESNTELADNLSRLKDAVEQDPSNPTIINSIKAGLSFYPKGRDFLKEQEAADLARKKAEGVGAKPVDKETFEQELKLANEYEKATAPYQKVKSAYSNILASDKSAAGNLSLVFGFMKMLDPGSVVKETEVATVSNAAGVPERVRNIWNKLVSGESVGQDQIDAISAQAKKIYDAAAVQEKEARKGIERRAKAYGLNPDRIFNMEVESVPEAPKSETVNPPAGALLPYDPKNKDAKRTMARLEKQDALILPSGGGEEIGTPSLIPPMPEGAVRLKRK